MNKKDILVIGHERSGNHFLINSIANNFDFDPIQIDVPPTIDENKLKIFFENYEPTGKNIVKSHHQFSSLFSFWNYIEKKFNVFYIMREGRDVITSCHYYFNKATKEFPFTKTVGELMRKNPQMYSFDSAYSLDRSNTIIERWVKHILGWIDTSLYHKFSCIEYEKLYTQFKDIINFISYNIKIESNKQYIRPLIKNSRSVAPRKGVIGDFITHLNKNENNYFFKEVNRIDENNLLYTDFFNKDAFYIEYRGNI